MNVDLHAALLVAAGVVVAQAVARGRLRGRLVLGLLAFAAAWTAIVVTSVDLLPVGFFVPVREGFTPHHLREVTGEALDAAPLRDELWVHLLFPGRSHWRVIVGTNLVHAGWSAALAGGLLAAVARSRGTGALVGLHAVLLPAVSLAPRTETAAPVLWTVALLALVGLGWAGAPEAGRLGKAVGLVTAALAALTFPQLRPEGLALSGLVGLAGLGVLLPGPDARLGRVATEGARWLAARPAVVAGCVAALLVGAVLLPAPLPTDTDPPALRWVLGALHPLHVQEAGAVAWFFGGWLSPLLAWFALRGLARGLARPLAWGSAGVALFVLVGTMRVAAHGAVGLRAAGEVAPWELARYGLGLLPVLGALVLLGLPERLGRAERALAWLPVPALPVLALLAPSLGPGLPWGGAPRTAAQAEVRALAAWSDAHPHCALVTRGLTWGTGAPVPRWHGLVPDLDGHRLVALAPPADADLDAVVAAVPGAPRCVQGWEGLDSFARPGAGAAFAGLPGAVVAEGVGVYVHPDHGVVWTPVPTAAHPDGAFPLRLVDLGRGP